VQGFIEYMNEKYSEDVMSRTEAKEFYKKLVEFIEKDNFENAISTPRFQGFTYPAMYIDPKYTDLAITLGYGSSDFDVQEGNFMGGYGRLPDNNRVIIVEVLKRPYSTERLIPRMQEPKCMSSFIHEFIHYQDEKKYTDDHFKNKSIEAGQKGDFKTYVNSPHEFNAYYQQGLSEIDDVLTQENLYTYKKFYDWAVPFFDSTFIKNINEKYKRKFHKRLADYYQLSKREL